MKFLIDECLSTTLVAIAQLRGYPESTHVTWLGLRSREDWALVRRAVEDGYVLVTHDSTDFMSLMERAPSATGAEGEELHGLRRTADSGSGVPVCLLLGGWCADKDLKRNCQARFRKPSPQQRSVSTAHPTWLGLRSRQGWARVRRAVNDG